ncbi:MAG: hypothetical protein H3C45_02750 [Bacteroidia bacterium]|nr:hypothetical protein [Bacteroidia bacterium]
MKLKLILIGLFFTFIQVSCVHDEEIETQVRSGNLVLHIAHQVGSTDVQFDTVIYTNKAGNEYTISRINYYLSNFVLYNEGKIIYQTNTPVYVDARNTPITIKLANIPEGKYDKISMLIGLDATTNIHGKIPDTDENIGMLWPESMGGGYHFLKLEGKFNTPDSVQRGYAVHVGLNPFIITQQPININVNITDKNTSNLDLVMNMNEWYQNPYTYDLYTDGNYTMGDSITMFKIAENGKDVFYAK